MLLRFGDGAGALDESEQSHGAFYTRDPGQIRAMYRTGYSRPNRKVEWFPLDTRGTTYRLHDVFEARLGQFVPCVFQLFRQRREDGPGIGGFS